MKTKGIGGHIGITAAGIFFLVFLPLLVHFDLFSGKAETDAVSSATVPLPEEPSGSFLVLINTKLHKDTLEEWEAFFRDGEFVVIFEDISCLAAKGDAAGQQLAERFRASLPENQMQLRLEDGTLLASKAEAGLIDVAVLSREMAGYLQLGETKALPGLTVLEIGLEGGAE